MTTSSTHPVRLRWRPDLEAQSRRLGGQRRWVVRDPLTRRHFQFQDEEYALAILLDGKRDLDEIRSQFERDFPARHFSATRFQLFLTKLHRDGLLLSDAPGQNQVLQEREARQRRTAAWTWLTNILAIRFRGVDPDRALSAMEPWVRWLFSPVTAAVCIGVIVAAVALMVTHWSELPNRLPSLPSVFRPDRIGWLAVVLAGTKVMHELGHALTCKRFGGECREIGVMLLVFTPCLYCDVSDSWMIPSRWHRAAVAAAGIFVELVLAAICTFLWWFSQPGTLHDACLMVMVVCGVGTLVFNANPLLRYDGYFILSDWLDIPNLWQRSRTTVRSALGRWCLGMQRSASDGGNDERVALLAAYGIGSAIYRVVILFGCLAFVLRLFTSWGLESAGWLICLGSVAGMVLPEVAMAGRNLRDPMWRRNVRPARVRMTMFILAVLALLAVLVPLPCRVRAPALLQVASAEPVYVQIAGTLLESQPPGGPVGVGESIARLDNPMLRRELARWVGEQQVHATRLAALESFRGDDPTASARIPATREALLALQQLVNQRTRDLERLELKAPTAGVILFPPARTQATGPVGQLPSWIGAPLDANNRGAFLENGTLACWVGDPRRREAIVYVTEAEVEWLRPGQRVRLQCAPWPGATFEGTLVEIAQVDAQLIPPELAAESELALDRDSRGGMRPVDTTYQVRVDVQAPDLPPLNRVRGEVKVHVAPRSLATRLHRALRRAFAQTE